MTSKPHFFPRLLPARLTLGAEKKSGVPYILTSPRRHRQTPASKHDEKTRHVGFAHVAQPSYRAYSYFGEVFSVATIRCCVRCWGPCGIPQLLGLVRRRRVEDNAPYHFRSRGTRDPTVFGGRAEYVILPFSAVAGRPPYHFRGSGL